MHIFQYGSKNGRVTLRSKGLDPLEDALMGRVFFVFYDDRLRINQLYSCPSIYITILFIMLPMIYTSALFSLLTNKFLCLFYLESIFTQSYMQQYNKELPIVDNLKICGGRLVLEY